MMIKHYNNLIIKSYPYVTSVGKACKEEFLLIIKNDFTIC